MSSTYRDFAACHSVEWWDVMDPTTVIIYRFRMDDDGNWTCRKETLEEFSLVEGLIK